MGSRRPSQGRFAYTVRLFLIALLLLLPMLACSLAQPDVDATPTAIAGEVVATQTAEAVGSATDDGETGGKVKGEPTPDVFGGDPVMVTVAADGTGDYATLSEAAQAVPAGSTILLGPGAHRLAEPLVLDRATILKGAGMDATEIVGTDTTPETAPSAVMAYTGEGLLEVSDLTIRREGTELGDVFWAGSGDLRLHAVRFAGALATEDSPIYAGARFSGEATGSVTDCEATGNNENGLRVEAMASIEIMDCVVSDNVTYGIVYTDDSTGAVLRTTVTGSGNSGIALMGGAQILVDDNLLEENGESGLVYFDAAGGTASNNQSTNNGLHGISVNDDAAPIIEGNTCRGNAEDGLVFFERASGAARQNTLIANGLHGIGVADEATPLLEDNVVTQNAEVGIRYSQSAGGIARGNEVSESGLSGIIVNDSAAPLLEDNVATNNLESGLAYFDSGAGSAIGNRFAENGLHGIDIYGTASPLIEENLLEDNAEAGIRISDDAVPVVQGNSVSRSGLAGIIVRDRAAPTISDNVTASNGESGITYFGSSHGVARGNRVTDNGSNGIAVNDEAAPTVQENEIRDNTEAGLAYFESGGGVAQVNAITGNQWGIYVEETATPAIGDNVVEGNTTDIDDRRPVSARPTPPPTTPEIAAGKVLFADDFTSPDPGWWTGTSDSGDVWFEDGEIRLLNWTESEFAAHTSPDRSFTDVVITVDSRHVAGTLDNWHDVTCRRQSADAYYMAGYSADGYVKMIAKYAGETTYYLDIETSSLVLQGSGVTNKIELSCVGSTIRFSLNGSLVGEFTDDVLVDGDIGFSISALDGDSSTVAFDNLVVTEP